MRVEETVDKVQVSRPTRSRAYREIACCLRLAGGGERGDFLVPNMHPLDRSPTAESFGQPVEAVADNAEYALHARLLKGLYEEIGYIADLHRWLLVLGCARFEDEAVAEAALR
jgi:hypothetical protein